MATTRADLRGYIFSAIHIDSITSLLGAVIDGNRRIYSHWPQERPVLGGVEPPEGWISFHELSSSRVFGGSNIEDHIIQFNCWNTIDSNNDLVIDILDSLFDQPPVDQNGILITDTLSGFPETRMSWVILLTQRVLMNSIYEDDIKMYRKIVNYQMRTTKIPYRVGT